MEKVKDESLHQYLCGHCKKSFKSLPDLKNHITSHKKESDEQAKKPAKCTLCEKVLSSVYKLQRHIRSVHWKRKDFACDICEQRFSEKSQVKDHKIRIHQNVTQVNLLECSTCNKIFQVRKCFERHECVISGLKKYKCSQCEMKFTSTHYVTQHKKRVHKPEEEKYIFRCEICSKSYSSKSNLQMHIELVHSENDKSKCKQCGKHYASKQNLQKHETNVHNPKSYKCKVCEEIFPTSHSLLSHIIQIHPNVCKTCKNVCE